MLCETKWKLFENTFFLHGTNAWIWEISCMNKFSSAQFVGEILIFFFQNAKWLCVYVVELSGCTKIRAVCRKRIFKSAQNSRIAVFWTLQDSMAKSSNSLWLPTLIYNNWTFFIGPSSSTLRKLNRWRWQFFSTGIKAWEVTFQLFFNDRLQNAEGRWVPPQAKPKNVRKKKEISQKKKREQLLWISVFAKTSSKKGLLFSTALMMHEFAVPTQKPHFTFSDLSIFRFFERCLCCWGGKKNLLLTPSWLQNFFPQAHWSELCYKKKRGNKSFVSGSADGDDWIFGA